MTTNAPAEIGSHLDSVETPALLIDLDALERNLEKMARAMEQSGVRIRPHSKTHKSPIITLMQMSRGAVGACCQTVAEAEALIRGGVPDVLISNQVVGERKITRLAALAKQARMGACVDDLSNVDALAKAAAEVSSTLHVLVEIDVGMGRCGVPPGQPAVALAKRVRDSSGLRFAGLQAYHGSAQHIRDFDERREAIAQASAVTRATIERLEANGLECEIVAGAGTGTYPFEAASGVYNELQAGSYIFMDADYAKNKKCDGRGFDDFEHSLFVLTTVISTPSRERAVVDAGLKAHSVDSGLPTLADLSEIAYVGASDEHGQLNLGSSNQNLGIGDKLRLIPGHCDPTVNLYDWYVGYRGDRVEALWPVAARGPGC